MEKLSGVLWRVENALLLVLQPVGYTMQPNPAKDFMTLEYSLLKGQGEVLLLISDPMGKVVFSQTLNTKNGRILWDTRSLANGNYIYTLKSNSEVLDQGLLSVVK